MPWLRPPARDSSSGHMGQDFKTDSVFVENSRVQRMPYFRVNTIIDLKMMHSIQSEPPSMVV